MNIWGRITEKTKQIKLKQIQFVIIGKVRMPFLTWGMINTEWELYVHFNNKTEAKYFMKTKKKSEEECFGFPSFCINKLYGTEF